MVSPLIAMSFPCRRCTRLGPLQYLDAMRGRP